MGERIKTEIFTPKCGFRIQRVGRDGFAAVVSSDDRGTHPLVVFRSSEDPKRWPPYLWPFGGWTLLHPETYTLAETSPVAIYGGTGSFTLTPSNRLTAMIEADMRALKDIDTAIAEMMRRGVLLVRERRHYGVV